MKSQTYDQWLKEQKKKKKKKDEEPSLQEVLENIQKKKSGYKFKSKSKIQRL